MWNASRVGFTVGVGGQPVDAPEDQGLAADLQLLEAVEAGSDHDVPLGHGLKGAAPLAERRVQHVQGGRPHGLEPVVGMIDVGLLGGEVGMRHKRDRRLLAFPRLRRKPATPRPSPPRPAFGPVAGAGGDAPGPPVPGRRWLRPAGPVR